MTIVIGGGITVGGGISIGRAVVDPATNTGGFNLAVLGNMPQDLYPAVSVCADSQDAQFLINPTSTYGTPEGFNFLNDWSWTQFDSNYVTVTTETNTDDTVIALGGADNAVLGSVAIAPGTKCMYSVTHTVFSGDPAGDAVGVGSATTQIIGNNTYLGLTNQSLAVQSLGQLLTNGVPVSFGYSTFQTNGQIIDVVVDTVNNKMWYRVDGGAWQG